MKKLIFLLLFTPLLLAAQTNRHVLWGSNYMYSMAEPDGWTYQNNAGIGEGYDMVVYTGGSDWKTAESAIYCEFKNIDGDHTLEFNINKDIRDFEARTNGKAKYVREVPYSTGFFRVFTREYKDGKTTVYEDVAYTLAPNGMVMVTLHSTNKKTLTANQTSMDATLKSYGWLTDKIELQTED